MMMVHIIHSTERECKNTHARTTQIAVHRCNPPVLLLPSSQKYGRRHMLYVCMHVPQGETRKTSKGCTRRADQLLRALRTVVVRIYTSNKACLRVCRDITVGSSQIAVYQGGWKRHISLHYYALSPLVVCGDVCARGRAT